MPTKQQSKALRKSFATEKAKSFSKPSRTFAESKSGKRRLNGEPASKLSTLQGFTVCFVKFGPIEATSFDYVW